MTGGGVWGGYGGAGGRNPPGLSCACEEVGELGGGGGEERKRLGETF